MKKTFVISLILVLSLLLAACGGAGDEISGKFRVAVVMPSAINDLAFSQSRYDALKAIESEMGADNFEFVYSDNMFVVDDAAAALLMVDDRNLTVHTYNEDLAHEIAARLPEHAALLRTWLVQMQARLDQSGD